MSGLEDSTRPTSRSIVRCWFTMGSYDLAKLVMRARTTAAPGGRRAAAASGPAQDAVAAVPRRLADHVQGVRHGERDFRHRYPAVGERPHHLHERPGVGEPDHGDDPAVGDPLQIAFAAHAW